MGISFERSFDVNDHVFGLWHCVFGLRFFEGDTDTVFFLNQAFNQTFKIYFTIFGNISINPSCACCYEASQLKAFHSWVPGDGFVLMLPSGPGRVQGVQGVLVLTCFDISLSPWMARIFPSSTRKFIKIARHEFKFCSLGRDRRWDSKSS